MTVHVLLTRAAARLKPTRIVCAADRSVGWLEAEILLAHALRRDRAWLLAHEDETVSGRDRRQFAKYISHRVQGEPIAYIVGTKEFYGRPFLVNRNVLIPRPETELLVDLVKRSCMPPSTEFIPSGIEGLGAGSRPIARAANAVIWDIGTGSGAVGVTLALELPRSSVIATDISTKTVKIAVENVNRLGAANRMHILKADLLDQTVLRLIKRHTKTRPLIIVANLPYLPNADRKKLPPDVVKYEPKDALFAGADGLAVIGRFLGQVAESGLKPRAIFLEFDPPQTVKLKKLARRLFPRATVSVHKDLAGRNRALEITQSR